MKRNRMIVLVAIVSVAVVITGYSTFSIDEREIDNPLQIGFFLTYNCTYEDSFSHNISIYQITYEILAINGNYLDYNITENGNPSTLLAQIKYETPFAFKPEIVFEGGETCLLVGNENVNLKWGMVNTEHYITSQGGSPPNRSAKDLFLYQNILVKEEFDSLYSGKYVMTLVETNMPQLTELGSPPYN